MVNINLSNAPQEEKIIRRRKLIDQGIVVSLAIVGVTIAVYAGVNLYGKSLNKKVVALQEVAFQAQRDLRGSDVERILDFQGRLDLIDQSLDGRYRPVEDMKHMEENMVQGAYLDAYEVVDGQDTVSLTVKAATFTSFVRQVMSFKQSGVFKEVFVKSVKQEDNAFVINMDLVKN